MNQFDEAVITDHDYSADAVPWRRLEDTLWFRCGLRDYHRDRVRNGRHEFILTSRNPVPVVSTM